MADNFEGQMEDEIYIYRGKVSPYEEQIEVRIMFISDVKVTKMTDD